MRKKKLKNKIVVTDPSEESIKVFRDFKLEFRTLPGFSMAPLMIGGDIVLIFNFQELSVIMIKNKTVAQQFKFLFDSLWKIAKK